MLTEVSTILSFGFLGLSFLMLYLGYNLIKESTIAGKEVHENKSKLIQYFMKVALTFMVLAGPLQWITMGVKYWMNSGEKKIHLSVGLNSTQWKNNFGNIYIRKDGKFVSISDTSVDKEVKEGDEILVNMSEVASIIDSMRHQIQTLNEKMPSMKTENKNIVLQEG